MNGLFRVFCNVMAYVSCREYAKYSAKCAAICRKSGWHREFYSSLTELGSVGDFLFLKEGLLWFCSQNDGEV